MMLIWLRKMCIRDSNISGLNALQSLGLFATKDVDGNDTAELKKYKDIADGTVTAKDDEQRQVAKAIVKIYENTYTADNLAADKKTVTDYEAVSYTHLVDTEAGQGRLRK